MNKSIQVIKKTEKQERRKKVDLVDATWRLSIRERNRRESKEEKKRKCGSLSG